MGVRQAIEIIAVISIALILSGCAEKTCRVTTQEPVIRTFETYSDQEVTEEKLVVTGQNCVEKSYSESDSKFNISMEEPEWVSHPPIYGESNYLRRKVFIYNGKNEIDTAYVDKVYFYNGTEQKRSKYPYKFLVEPKSSRQLYVIWGTQYDPLKDVTLEFTNNTDVRIMRMCYNETEKVTTTKTVREQNGTESEIIGYEEIVRVKLDC